MKRARSKKRSSDKVVPINANVKKGKKPKKKGKAWKKIAAVLVIVVAVIFIGLGFQFGGDNALLPVDTSTGKMNVLLMGVDKEGLRTDAVMLASYDFDTESVKLLSLPRDTKFYVTNKKKYRKLTEIHALSNGKGDIVGPLGTIEAVTAITSIPIHYYVEFSFDAIDHVMDILGPVTFDVPDIEGNGQGMNYDDPAQDLHIHLKPGVQELSGNQVQQFLRYRKSNKGTVDGSDISRVGRQQEFVKALIDQKVNMALIIKAGDIFSEIKKEIKTNFSGGEVARYATHLLKLDPQNIQTFQLPGADKHEKAWYFVCDLDEAKTLIETEFGYDASGITNKVEITGKAVNPKAVKKAEKTEETSEPTEKATAKPSKKQSPQDTKEPAATKKPAKTETPEKTAKPAEEETPKPTKKATPEPTEEPAVEDEPEIDSEPDDDVIVIDE